MIFAHACKVVKASPASSVKPLQDFFESHSKAQNMLEYCSVYALIATRDSSRLKKTPKTGIFATFSGLKAGLFHLIR